MDEWISFVGIANPMSSMSHLAGMVVFLVLSFFMLQSAWGFRQRFWYSFVFAFAAVFMLTMSFIYHIFEVGYLPRAIMLRLDVAAIFVLIAATFTPIHGVLFTGWRHWGMLGVLWTIAVLGATLRLIFFESIPDTVGIGIFLAMGWIGAVSAYLLYHDYGGRVVFPVILGGVLYSIGAVINAADWPVMIDKIWGAHETFHLFVLAALGTHWALISKIADGSICRPECSVERRAGRESGH